MYVLWKMPLQLKLILMTNLFSPQKPFSTCEKRSACMNNVLSFSIDWFFLAHSRPYHLISPDNRMADWKDSYDSWKDSRLPRQLIAVLFSWKSLSHQSTGSWYKFFNCKMLRPARLTQLAGSTPQCRFHTDCHHPSKVVQMFHADLFLEFLLPYKGTANLIIDGKHIFRGDIFFDNDRSAQSLLERFTRFDCYFSRFVSTKVRCFLAVCIIFGRIHTTESFFDCTVP